MSNILCIFNIYSLKNGHQINRWEKNNQHLMDYNKCFPSVYLDWTKVALWSMCSFVLVYFGGGFPHLWEKGAVSSHVIIQHIGQLVRFPTVSHCLGRPGGWSCGKQTASLFSESDSSRRLVTDLYSGVCLSLRACCGGGFQCVRLTNLFLIETEKQNLVASALFPKYYPQSIFSQVVLHYHWPCCCLNHGYIF